MGAVGEEAGEEAVGAVGVEAMAVMLLYRGRLFLFVVTTELPGKQRVGLSSPFWPGRKGGGGES